jgi:pantoate--beta-alanine ligase
MPAPRQAANRNILVMKTVAELRDQTSSWRENWKSIGLVPTMGALHDGHMTLIKRAKVSCERVIVTIFVNPKQFNRPEDLAKYPRTLAEDIEMCSNAGADIVFTPDESEIYPAGFSTKVSVSDITQKWEGEFRPGHFDGVATVVAKLLLMAMSDQAFFGEKDYQQLLLIQHMARDLNIPTEIIGCPTYREEDGLAFASRNRLLSAEQRKQAPAIYKVMRELASEIKAGGDPLALSRAAASQLQEAGFSKVDYLAAVDNATLAPLTTPAQTGRILCAAWLGTVRLIDNMGIEEV